MANLSAYIGFDVYLDFNSKEIYVEADNLDTLPPEVTGITITAKVKQPDCIWGTLPVTVSGIDPLSFEGSRSLRMNTAGNPQKGNYTVILTVVSPGYDNTVIEKTFNLQYSRPVISITKEFDLLTPSLLLRDNTRYEVPGLDLDGLDRDWEIQLGGFGSIEPDDEVVSLSVEGQAYDAKYSAILEAELYYESDEYDFLTIYDEVTGTFETTANTIPAYSEFPAMLMYIREESGVPGDCCEDACLSADYKIAFTLFQYIAQHICDPETTGLQEKMLEFLDVYYKYAGAYVNTDVPIPAYDRSFCSTDPGIGENNFIRNTTQTQIGSNINIDGGITASGTPHAADIVSRFLVMAENGTYLYVTAEELVIYLGLGDLGAHSHEIADVNSLQAALDSKVVKNANITAGSKAKITYDVKGLVVGGVDLVEADIPALNITKTTGLQAALDSKAEISHTHSIAEVTALQATLDAKALDANVVHKTGDENINGIKVFILPPIVPTPVNNTQIANKKYVDDTVLAMVGAVPPGPYQVTLLTNGTFVAPAGTRLRGMVVRPTLDSTIQIGINPGGTEILYPDLIIGGIDKDINIALTFRTATTIYFQGVVSSTQFLIYLDTLTPAVILT